MNHESFTSASDEKGESAHGTPMTVLQNLKESEAPAPAKTAYEAALARFGIADEKNEDISLAPKGPEAVSSSPKDKFMEALDGELLSLVESGRLSAEQAKEKRSAGALIETGFSDSPDYDALLFSRTGIANEKELIEMFNASKIKDDTLVQRARQRADMVVKSSKVQESASSLEEAIQKAENFDDIERIIASSGGIQGTQDFFSVEELTNRLTEVMNGGPIELLTRTGGLRDKVEKLLNEAVPENVISMEEIAEELPKEDVVAVLDQEIEKEDVKYQAARAALGLPPEPKPETVAIQALEEKKAKEQKNAQEDQKKPEAVGVEKKLETEALDLKRLSRALVGAFAEIQDVAVRAGNVFGDKFRIKTAARFEEARLGLKWLSKDNINSFNAIETTIADLLGVLGQGDRTRPTENDIKHFVRMRDALEELLHQNKGLISMAKRAQSKQIGDLAASMNLTNTKIIRALDFVEALRNDARKGAGPDMRRAA